jgi:hypothetical protein
MLKKILMLVAIAGLTVAQTQVPFQAFAPPAVTGFGSGIQGTAGTTYACYWVVANYIGGGVLSTPTCPNNVPNSLSGSNYVQLSWNAVAGAAVTYDVLKTTTNVPPIAGASVSLTTGLTVTTYNDTGGSLSGYTIAAYPYAQAGAIFTLNNRDFVQPAVVCTGSTASPCHDAVDQVLPKPANNVIRLGGLNAVYTPFTIDKTGAAFMTNGSPAVGAPIGTVTAGVVYSVSATLTLAQINAGIVILPAVTGQTYKVSHFLMTATGTAATCTSVNISDTAGTPVNAAAVAIAALTSGTPVDETISGVTLTAFAPTTLTAGQGIQIRHVGSSCATTTSLAVTVYFTINS